MTRLFAIILLATIATTAVATETTELTFDQALTKILERNTDIGQQEENLKSTEAQALPLQLTLLPAISVDANRSTSQLFGSTKNTSRWSLGAEANLNLFKFGADSARMSQANHSVKAQEAKLSDVVLQSEAEAVNALVDYIQNKASYEITQEILKSRQRLLKIANLRYTKGLVPQEEVDKVSIDLDNAQAQSRDAQLVWVSAQAELQRLIGTGSIGSEWPWKAALQAINLESDRFKTPSLSTRPDWIAAEQTYKRSKSIASESWGSIFPSLGASLRYDYLQIENGGATNSGPQWVAGLTLTVPLFDKLTNISQYRSAVHLSKASELALEAVRRKARAEWSSAFQSVTISIETAKVRDNTVKTARRVFDSSQKRFDRGLVKANEFLLEQERLYQSELYAIRGWAAAHTQFTTLCHSIGQRVQRCLQSN